MSTWPSIPQYEMERIIKISRNISVLIFYSTVDLEASVDIQHTWGILNAINKRNSLILNAMIGGGFQVHKWLNWSFRPTFTHGEMGKGSCFCAHQQWLKRESAARGETFLNGTFEAQLR